MINIRFAVAAALLSVGGVVVASAQQPTQPQKSGEKHAHVRGQRADGIRDSLGVRGLRGQLFKGITLSDAEKASIKNVQAKYAPQMKALREQAKPQLQAAREARQRGDTAAVKAMWEKSAAQREQTKQLLVAERSDLRTALTPANQAKFDANVAALEKRVAERAQDFGKHGGRRALRPGKAIR
jgi:Spy/CpxP family protein refolding chaperone